LPGTLTGMHAEDLIPDVVLFEFSGGIAAHSLSRRLQQTWSVWTEPDEAGWIVGAELRAAADDLAVLLRTVAEWLGERRLRELAFQVDGRVYALLPAERGAEVAA
jgi:hypothetical protein